jgi:uncharacterized ParB-like nuclease family protein
VKPKEIPLDKIRIDGETQSRVKLDETVVTEYADALRDGADLPPVEVCHDGSDYWLFDGFHRLLAHQDAGLGVVACLVRKGTKADAQWLSYGANTPSSILGAVNSATERLPNTSESRRRSSARSGRNWHQL